MARSEIPDDDRYWGSQSIDLTSRDLPRLKAQYLVDALPATGRVLEVGCGGGRMLQTLARHRPGLELHGVDIRPLRVAAPEFEFRLVGVDDTELPYDPGSFDAVVVFDVFEHLPDPAVQVAAVHRVLRPGGELVSFTPLEGNPLAFHKLYRKLLGDDLYVTTKDHRQAFSERSLDALLAPSFAVRDRRYVYHLLGQLMDATMFASMRFDVVRRRLADDNPYYQDEGGADGEGAVAAAIRFANLLAYFESRALGHVAWGSAGMLFRATPR